MIFVQNIIGQSETGFKHPNELSMLKASTWLLLIV